LMDEQAYRAQLSDYDAWMQSGRAMLASADLIWPKVQALFARTQARAEAVRKAFETGGLPMSQAVGRTLPTLGLENFQEMLGYGNAFLLNAGHAIENLIKAVRIKRLSLSGQTIEFGAGPDRIPRTHTKYDEMAGHELGTLSDAEATLLRRLALYVQWAGRYPMPTKPPPVDDVNGRSLQSTDRDRVHAIAQRLIDKFESLQAVSPAPTNVRIGRKMP
jgi:hypothetical protein